MVEPDRPQMSVWRMCIACWMRKATDTHSICNTNCFSTATVVSRTRLNVMCTCTLPVLLDFVLCIKCKNRNTSACEWHLFFMLVT
jgi:hypothetical protein